MSVRANVSSWRNTSVRMALWLAVMTGLQQELRDRILGSQPHIYVSKTGGIADYQVPRELRLELGVSF